MTNRRTKMLAALAIAGVVLLGGSSCDVAEDRQSAAGTQPDAYADTTDVTLWRNADGTPNVARFCADGLAWAATLSSDGAKTPTLLRVPERDSVCAK